jgi:hypothetical protein
LFRLFSLLLLPFFTNNQHRPPVVFTQNTPDSEREKKAIDAQKRRQWEGTSHAPVHVSLCHIAAPFPLHNPAKVAGMTSSAPSAANEVRAPRPGVRYTVTCPALSYTPHLSCTCPHASPPPSPAPSALQTPMTRPISFFVVQITDFDEFRIRGLLVHLCARCVCVPKSTRTCRKITHRNKTDLAMAYVE